MIRCLLFTILLLLSTSASSNLILDGSPTWQTNNWYTQVDGVMGGLSSGQLNFIDDNSILSFSGTISLDGGGFSSVRRRQFPIVNLQQYSGIVVTLQSTSTTTFDNSDDVKVPLGLHLQFHDTKDSFGYASAFAIPITKTQNEEIQIYLPLSSFDRGTRIGFQCTNCQIDWSIINGMDIYVLFQEGNFQIKVDSIVAVVEDVQSFDIPSITFDNVNQLGNVIEKTIKNGGGLYDYDYKELCIAVYKSTLNTIVGSSSSEDTTNEEDVVSKKIKSMICQGLQRAETQGNDKVNVAWTLRHTLDSVLEEIGRKAKVVDGSVWRPEDLDTYLQCNGVTSGSSGAYKIVSKSDSPTQMPSIISTKTETLKPTVVSTPLISTSPATMPPSQTPTTNRPSSANPTIMNTLMPNVQSTNGTTTSTSMPTLVPPTTTYAPNPMLMISTSSSPAEVKVEEGAEVITPMAVENEVDEDKAMLDTSASPSISKGSAGIVSVFFSVGLYASLYAW